jgi:elongation factor P
MLTASDFRRGLRIEIDGEPYTILDVHFQTPSARGASTLVKMRARNLRTGAVLDRTFRSSDTVAEPHLALRQVQYLYEDAEGYHFMDTESYDQFALTKDDLGDAALYLLDGMSGIRSVVFNDNVISIDLPQSVRLRIIQTDPALKGATAQAQTKPATLETGLVVQVPSYLETGEAVQIDTREGRFISRAKD